MAGGGDNSTNGARDQRAMEEGRKQEEFAADQGCAALSVPFIQKVRGQQDPVLAMASCSSSSSSSPSSSSSFPPPAPPTGETIFRIQDRSRVVSWPSFLPCIVKFRFIFIMSGFCFLVDPIDHS
jgi:hypothetical protein